MDDLTISAMQQMQAELQEKYFDRWGGLSPAQGRSHLEAMLCVRPSIEAVACYDIRPEGAQRYAEEMTARFVEELCDVYMYLASTAMCYGITPQELAHTFVEKHRRNMQRW